MSEVSKFSPDEGMTIYDIKDKNGRIMSEKLIRNTVGWTGKNRLKYDLASLKAGNTGGTWNGNNYTIAGVTYTVNSDNSLSAANSASSASEVVLYYGDNYLENGKEYRITNGVAKNAGYFLAINGHASDGTWKKVLAWTTVDGNEVFTNDISEYPKIRVVLHINSGVNPNITFKPMICDSAITDDTYEPYHYNVNTDTVQKIGGVVGWTRKNLLKNEELSKSYNGITFTINSDKSITVNGTASAYTTFRFNNNSIADYANGDYILSDGFNGTSNNCWIVLWDATASSALAQSNQSQKLKFTVDDVVKTHTVYFELAVANGATVSSKTVCPMIRAASNQDPTYEPYHDTVSDEITDVYKVMGELGAKNFFSLVKEGFSQWGNNTDGFNIDAATNGVVYVAKVNQNTNYTITKQAGNRFKLIGYTSYPPISSPAISGNGHIIADDNTITEYTFNSGSYNYVGLTANGTDAYVLSNIKVMIRFTDDLDSTYQPYAMTNRELTENVIPEDITNNYFTAFPENVTLKNGSVYKIGKLIIGNIVINKTDNFELSTDVKLSVDPKYLPRVTINNIAFLLTSEWGVQSYNGYMFINSDGQNQQFIINNIVSGTSNLKFAKIHFVYCCK